MPIKLSEDALVLRHFPIGKGFLVRLPDNDRYLDEREDAGRPPFLFVKCWKITYAKMTVRGQWRQPLCLLQLAPPTRWPAC